MVQRFDMESRIFPELCAAGSSKLDVPPHGEVRTVHLQQKARLVDGLVLFLHRVCQRREVGLMARIILVLQKERDYPGRGSAQKGVRRLYSLQGCSKILEVFLYRRLVSVCDRTGTRRGPHSQRTVAEDPLAVLRKFRQIRDPRHIAETAFPLEPTEAVFDIRGVADS